MQAHAQIPRALLAEGKVRQIYDDGAQLLLLTSDRISAFDVVFQEEIQDKGRVLNLLSAFWFDWTKELLPNHMISVDVSDYPPDLQPYKALLQGRSMWVKKAEMLPVECIVRGYLEGSALKSYQQDGTINGEPLPQGLRQGDRLPAPRFTPSTKAASGHDENISRETLANLLGQETAQALESKALALYEMGAKRAQDCGLILADCKFEFGVIDGELCICDELFTPDSSRFWDAESWSPGKAQQSFDKQFLREYLEGCGWDKSPPAPQLPEAIVEKTRARYLEAYRRLTGERLETEDGHA